MLYKSTKWFFIYLILDLIGIWKCWFLRPEENQSTPEKPVGVKERTNKKLNPHIVSIPGFEPGPLWWEVSAHTTAPPLAPRSKERGEKYVYIDK